jgi:hypothetical protein
MNIAGYRFGGIDIEGGTYASDATAIRRPRSTAL